MFLRLIGTFVYMKSVFKDQLHAELFIPTPPRKIVSLVPSQTELLADLGLEDRVVGITKFCVHPNHWRTTKTIVGGTKNFDFEAIDKIKPDLIIGNKEENYEEGIRALQTRYTVWMSDIVSLEDSLEMIRSIGIITDKELPGKQLADEIQTAFTDLTLFNQEKVLYLIWRKPWMGAGQNTFIDTVLNTIGLVNAVQDIRYPELTPEQIQAINPDYVFLSSEPYPFKEKHLKELQQLVPKARVVLVDGEMFSWYGSRLLLAPAYLRTLHSQLKSQIS